MLYLEYIIVKNQPRQYYPHSLVDIRSSFPVTFDKLVFVPAFWCKMIDVLYGPDDLRTLFISHIRERYELLLI